MFAHQVIEALEKRIGEMRKLLRLNASQFRQMNLANYMSLHQETIDLIKKGQHFFMGDQNSLLCEGAGKSLLGKQLFMEYPELMKLPYPICTFSTFENSEQIPSHLENGIWIAPSSKRFSVVEQSGEYIRIIFASYTDDLEVQKTEGVSWYLQSTVYVTRLGKVIEDVPSEMSHQRLNGRKTLQANMHVYEYLSQITHRSEDQGDLSVINAAMVLLNCKNITTEIIPAPAALNKKRRKAGKQEIFDYHVLNVTLPSNSKREYQGASVPLSHNRVHLCRGHFKEYTAEHPLFGRHTGLYWWQPAVRGQNRDGIVMKDYKIKTEGATA